jgi:hypothetical protein
MTWKPLDQIYINESANKKVDLLPRQKVNLFFEDNNLFRSEGDGYELIGTVDDKDYRKIVHIVKKEGSKSIDSLVEQSGFIDQTRYIKNFFGDFDVNYGEIEILSQIKQKLNSITGKIGGTQGELSLHEAVFPVLKKILANETPEKMQEFYNSLFVKSFSEGNVSVGDGELLLSLFTECFKGDVGDLKTPSGLNVELKVGKGRIISARGGGFKNDLDKLKEFASKPDLTIEDLIQAKFTGDVMKKAFANTSILQQFFDANITDPNKRMQHFAGIMLNEYGNEGFDVVLYVYQKGFTRKSGNVADTGTFDRARYLNVTNYSNILNAINNNFIAFDFDGDGVYIGYPGSNVNAKFKKDMKLS